MSKAEKFIQGYTRNCSNEMAFTSMDGSKIYHAWLTPDDAKSAVGIAREEMIEKAIGWIGEIYTYHEIMCYSDNHEPSLEELTEWFKNYMNEGGKDE